MYLAPQNIPYAVSVLTLCNRVILYCIVLLFLFLCCCLLFFFFFFIVVVAAAAVIVVSSSSSFVFVVAAVSFSVTFFLSFLFCFVLGLYSCKIDKQKEGRDRVFE